MLLANPSQGFLHLPVEQYLLERLVPLLGQLRGNARPRRAGPAQIDDDVAKDREQPGPERAELGIEAISGSPGAQEGVLDRLLGELSVVEGAQREAVELAGMGRVGLAEPRLLGENDVSHRPDDLVG